LPQYWLFTDKLKFEEEHMNRKKKLNDAYNKKLKKVNAKLRVSNKPKYISKAERENIALAAAESQLQDKAATLENI
jgi:Protein of unknown function (DUF2986)